MRQYESHLDCRYARQCPAWSFCRTWHCRTTGAHNARQLIAILEDDERYITQAVRIALGPLVTTLIEIEGQIAKLDKAILAAHRNDDVSLRLSTIHGIGPSSPLVFPPACRTQSCLRTGEFAALAGPCSQTAFNRWKAKAGLHFQNGQQTHAQASGGRGTCRALQDEEW